ncbi:hypothetical protein AXX17_AT1G75020 [Arabidopsis thaliana]|uniref:Pectin lyase-like superfamily protein n=1 Tax=Arabidopsis thaliana TaxID=3702 RepID=A0A178W6E1_ARATH|nr:hypothetical protein AXX17_AT1G75020 [Arabidopsis thaliana]
MSYSRGGTLVTLLLLLLVASSLALTANANSFESLLQLPRRQSRSTRPRSERLLHVGNFGAKGNGVTDDTKAFADAWKTACSSKVKTRILVPENYTCLLRPIDLSGPCKARLTLQVKPSLPQGYLESLWIFSDCCLCSVVFIAFCSLFWPLDLWYNHCSQ